jgi:hypothetical protein
MEERRRWSRIDEKAKDELRKEKLKRAPQGSTAYEKKKGTVGLSVYPR